MIAISDSATAVVSNSVRVVVNEFYLRIYSGLTF